jgi:mevalonate kinase
MGTYTELAFEIPSKTFIIGEYLAINGTASMVLASEPSFFIKTIEDKNFGFHPDSPAGRRRQELKQNGFGFSVFDPHEGRGGFGRSTAEYLAVHLYEELLAHPSGTTTEQMLENLEELVTTYQKSCGGEYRPSGADLVAQICGGLCWYDGMNFTAQSLAWPFPGYDIFIFHTGKKLATHEHLKDLPSKDLKGLIPILLAARTAYDQQNLKVFAESLNFYYDILFELGLSDKRVRQSVERLRSHNEVLAAKGCGAMGVDTVIVLAEKSDEDKVRDLCFAEDFTFISSLGQSHPGAQVRRPS